MSNHYTINGIDNQLIQNFFVNKVDEDVQYILTHKKFYKTETNDKDIDDVSLEFLITLIKNTDLEYNFDIPIFKHKGYTYSYNKLLNKKGEVQDMQHLKLFSKLKQINNVPNNIMFNNLDFNKIGLYNVRNYNNRYSAPSDDVSKKIMQVVDKFKKDNAQQSKSSAIAYNTVFDMFKKQPQQGGSEPAIPKISVLNDEDDISDDNFVGLVVNCILNNKPDSFKQCAHSLASTQMRPEYYQQFKNLPLEIRISMLRALDVKLSEKMVNGKKQFTVESFEEWNERNGKNLKDMNIDVDSILSNKEIDEMIQFGENSSTMQITLDNYNNYLTNNDVQNMKTLIARAMYLIKQNNLENNSIPTAPKIVEDAENKTYPIKNYMYMLASYLKQKEKEKQKQKQTETTGGMHRLRKGGNKEATYELITFIVHTLIDSVMHEQDKIGSLIQQDKSEMPTNSMGLKYVTQKQLQSQGEQYQKLGAFGYPPCDMAGINQLNQMSKLSKSMSGGGMQMGGASIFDRNFDILVKELKSKGHDLNSADVNKMKELIKKLEQLEEDMVEIISNIAKYNKTAKIQNTTPMSYDHMVKTLDELKKNGQEQNEKQNEIIGLFKEFYEVLNKFKDASGKPKFWE